MLKKETIKRADGEIAHRHGWQQGFIESRRITLQLIEQGYSPQQISTLMRVYNDHVVTPWCTEGDSTKMDPCPDFRVAQLREIVIQRGYDWRD